MVGSVAGTRLAAARKGCFGKVGVGGWQEGECQDVSKAANLLAGETTIFTKPLGHMTVKRKESRGCTLLDGSCGICGYLKKDPLGGGGTNWFEANMIEVQESDTNARSQKWKYNYINI
jgi:hypothetical protein